MTDEVRHRAAARLHCRTCQAEVEASDRYCTACGALVAPAAGLPHAANNKTGRTVAAIMFLSGLAILVFAAVHRNPADIILVVAFGLPLCGAGALGWRTP